MNLLKPIASFLVLFAYLISFGHGLIPHHHHDSAEADHHHHHTHEGAEDADHEHIAHEDHFDNGLIDYLACIFGNHEHQPNETDVLLRVTSDDKNLNKKQEVAVNIVTNIPDFSFYPLTASAVSHPPVLANRKQFFSHKKAKRGPPMA